ncbi:MULTISPECIES: hypothetical protein [unclassified Arsenophonus]|uniref:hypothetical protein n=1 Tax=unclassified Arsenophonus TaxID=2627083 RepID=UPI002857B01F|nr:hypothetical protein [Arsenophonus sp.]MDR5611287.1 hypothetical protein [Arsenophonus sp.]MDR5615354.1 hypothetical protein [Arsenophonus sp.]
MAISHTPKPTVWVFCGSLFQRKGVKERYCLVTDDCTCLHVRTPQAGYLATYGNVSDNS